MSGNFKMDDYVDVAARIAEFSDKYPEGSLQAHMEFLTEPLGWFCVARAYRTADDERPGIGHAFEPVPGKTPYTRDSEAQNAETSAWGRAIVALGFKTKKIASQQEVKARQSSSQGVPAGAGTAPGDMVIHFGRNAGTPLSDLTPRQLGWYAGEWQNGDSEQDIALKQAAILLKHGEVVSPSEVDPSLPF